MGFGAQLGAAAAALLLNTVAGGAGYCASVPTSCAVTLALVRGAWSRSSRTATSNPTSEPMNTMLQPTDSPGRGGGAVGAAVGAGAGGGGAGAGVGSGAALGVGVGVGTGVGSAVGTGVSDGDGLTATSCALATGAGCAREPSQPRTPRLMTAASASPPPTCRTRFM